MAEQNVTPRPWEVRVWGGGSYGRGRHEYINVESRDYPIARMYSNVAMRIDGEANAEHIVRCVNAHDDMAYRLQCLYFDLGVAPEELRDIDLTAMRLGIEECLERAGVRITTDPREAS